MHLTPAHKHCFFLFLLSGYKVQLVVMWYPCPLKPRPSVFALFWLHQQGKWLHRSKGVSCQEVKPLFDTTKPSCLKGLVEVAKQFFFFFLHQGHPKLILKKLPATEDLGNSWCDYQHVSRGWGRVRLRVRDTLSPTLRDWGLPVTCLGVSNGCVWCREKQVQTSSPMTWEAEKAPADYTAGVETQQLPHVRWRVWLLVTSSQTDKCKCQ